MNPPTRDESAQLIAALSTGRPDGERLTNAIADIIGEDMPTEVYLYILTNGVAAQEDLASQGYPQEALEAALTVLLARGLVRRDTLGWRVCPPEQSLPTLAGQLEARATNIRAALPGLVAAYRNASARHGSSPGIEGTERLSGEHEVSFALAQCYSNARTEARIMRVHSLTTRETSFDVLPGSREGHLSVTGRRITIHSVIDTALVADFDRDDFLALQQAPNVHVCLASGVPFTAAVNDEGMAVVETYLNGRIDGLVLRDPGLVAAVRATIDVMLRLSIPVRTATVDAVRDESAITDEERTILSLLTAGLPDATIARRLGVSPRTLDRRIRGLMDRLHASTRFQAGAEAARRGWL